MPYFSCSGKNKQNIVIDETEINSDVSMSTVKMKYETKALNKVFLNSFDISESTLKTAVSKACSRFRPDSKVKVKISKK